jgi:hypothetical protein
MQKIMFAAAAADNSLWVFDRLDNDLFASDLD